MRAFGNNSFLLKHWLLIGSLIVLGYTGATLATSIYHTKGIMPIDSYKYLDFAENVIAQGWESALLADSRASQSPPLLTILMVKLNAWGIPLVTAGRVINIGSCLMAALGVWFCCLKIYRERFTALCSALLVMSLPGWYSYGNGVIRDPLYWMMVIWSAFLWLKLAKYGFGSFKFWLTILAIALLGAVNIFCRKEALLIYAFEVVLIIGLATRELYLSPKEGRLRGFRNSIIALVIFLVPLALAINLLISGCYGYNPVKVVQNYSSIE